MGKFSIWGIGSLFQALRLSGPLRKCEHENKTGGNWEEEAPTFRVPVTFASSPLSESLEQAREY